MLETNKQNISDVESSFVQQANGNIHNYGLGYNDVKAICRDVIKQELSIVTREAFDSLNNEFAIFENKFIDRLKILENPYVIEKLRSPKLQFVLHDSMKGYAKVDDEDKKNELVDLLIERLKVEEHSTEQFFIDEAIEILPKLSFPCLYFLGALTQRSVISRGYTFIVNDSLKQQASLYKYLDQVSTLDIEYLKQINCCTSLLGLRHYKGIADSMRGEYDLLFRRAITKEEYDKIIPNLPAVKGFQTLYPDAEHSNKYKFLYSSKAALINDLKEDGKIDSLPIFEDFINSLPVFSDFEIKQYLVLLNKDWEKAFDVLDREDVQYLKLTPVGTYVGLRVVEKTINKRSALPLKDFYN